MKQNLLLVSTLLLLMSLFLQGQSILEQNEPYYIEDWIYLNGVDYRLDIKGNCGDVELAKDTGTEVVIFQEDSDYDNNCFNAQFDVEGEQWIGMANLNNLSDVTPYYLEFVNIYTEDSLGTIKIIEGNENEALPSMKTHLFFVCLKIPFVF